MADPYVYPGSPVLRNLFDIRDSDLLQKAERLLVAQRLLTMPPDVPISYDGYKALHRHLFELVYDWAGETRTVNLFKDETPFAPAARVDAAMAERFSLLQAEGNLRGQPAPVFAVRAAEHLSEINAIHPFGEGNGRTQRAFLEVLAGQAGHTLDLARIEPAAWHTASVSGFACDYRPMAALIDKALAPAGQEPFERWAGIGSVHVDQTTVRAYEPPASEIER